MSTDLNIYPDYYSRAFLTGKTGSGKSTLALSILDGFKSDSIIIIDPKCSRTLSQYTNTDDLSYVPILARDNNIVVYRPAPDVVGIDHWDVILKWVYDRQNTILCIDELFGLSDNGYTYPKWLKGLYTRGRERNITIIGQSQRPRGIPKYCMTESESAYIFELSEDDRKYLSSEFGDEILTLPDKYAFWYVKDRSKPVHLRIKI